MHWSFSLLYAFPLLSAAQYTIQDDYSIQNFANMFDFETINDPTNGYVNYVSLDQATSEGLWSTTGQSIYMGADYTKPGAGRGRDSVRIISKNSYNHGLFILDLAHMPEGCGTWPAYWLLGPDWPNSGEIDILEGVNSQAANSFAMHTNTGCSIVNTGKFTGTIASSNCDVKAPDQATNVGCAIKTTDTRSYGTGFNQAGGGVYATEWTSDAVSIWFFSRSQIPADISSGSPDPSGWGLPQAQFAGACDIDSHLKNQQIVFTNTFCGDWGGQVWAQDATCGPLASTCQAFVQNNPSAFKNAYWQINSLRVYQGQSSGGVNGSSPQPGVPSNPSYTVPVTQDPTTLVTITQGGSDAATVIGPQPANPTGAVVTQISDGQPQAPPQTAAPGAAQPTQPANNPQGNNQGGGAMVGQSQNGQMQAPAAGQQGQQGQAGGRGGRGGGSGQSWWGSHGGGRPQRLGRRRRHRVFGHEW